MSIKTKVLGKLIDWAAGSKIDRLYIAARDMLAGHKTYIVGISMVARGVAALIDSMQGTTLSDIMALTQDPAVDLITEGLGLMTLRAGISKVLKQQS